MTSKQQDIFFALLRRALWQFDDDRDNQLFSTITPEQDWKPILTAYYDHGVLGVVTSAIQSLPSHLAPSERQTSAMTDYYDTLCSIRYQMAQTIDLLFTTLEQAGCKPLLLKGEGLDMLYADDCQRAVGDIDILVDDADFEKGCIAIDHLTGTTPDVEAYYSTSEHHYHTQYEDIPVELHHCIADTKWEKHGTAMNRWAIDTITSNPLRSMPSLSRDIPLPPLQFDLFYVFGHMCKHLLNEGGGLRQIIDWAVLLHHVHVSKTPYDSNALQKALYDFQLLPTWQILTGILHHQLGLPISEIPFYNEKKAAISQSSILHDILAGGNFGVLTKDTSAEALPHGIRRTLITSRLLWRSYKKKRILFPQLAPHNELTILTNAVRNRLSRKSKCNSGT